MSRKAQLLTALLFSFSAAACGSTPCEEGVDKVQSCGFPEVELNEVGEECAEFAECQAECILEASCNQIKAAIDGEENELTACTLACGE